MADELDPKVLREINASLKSVSELLQGIPDKISSVAGWLRTGREEVRKTADESKKAAAAADQHAASQKKAAEEIKKTGDAAAVAGVKISDMGSIVGGGLASLGISLDGLSSQAKGLESQLGKMIEAAGLQGVDQKIELAATAFSVLGVAVFNVGESLSDLSGKFDVIGEQTNKSVVTSIESLKKSLDALGNIPGLSVVVGGLKGILGQVENFAGAVAGVRRMETGLMAMRGQFAGFSREGSRLEFIENLPRELSRFNEIIEGTATSMNLALEEAEKYAFELQKIPGAFDKIVRDGSDADREIRLLEKAMRVARGTTGDFEDAFKAMNLEFRQFGDTTNDSLDYLSRLYEMSNAIGVSFEDFRESVDKIVTGFSSLGDTSKSATELVGGLSKSLMSTGIGIEPTKRIIEGITGSMQDMNIAQKAFLSQQTGGAGGLQGAFQIEQMISQGDIRGVYEKMEQALRQQFGGRIVGLDEAAQDQNAASQFAKQRAFLEQGPFGALVKGAGDANKLLEAMSKGTGPDPGLLSRGDSAIGNALKADESVQEKQRDALITVANTTKALFREAQIHTALWARNFSRGDVGTVIANAESFAKQRAVTAMSAGEEDTFDWTSSGSRVLGKFTDLGTQGEELAKAVARNLATQMGVSGIRSAPGGSPGAAPSPVGGGGGSGITLPTTAAGGMSGPTDVRIVNEELRLVLESSNGEVQGRAVAKVQNAKATGGTTN